MLPDSMYDYRFEYPTEDVEKETCDECDEDIYSGYEYFDVEGKIYCKCCMESCRYVV